MSIQNMFEDFMKPFQYLAQEQEKWKKQQLENQRKAQEREQEAQRKAAEKAARCELMRKHIMELKANRANLVASSETGSAEYLKARYGDYAYRSMCTVVIRELELTEEKAAAFLTENYSEAMWKLWEDDDIEHLLGNR